MNGDYFKYLTIEDPDVPNVIVDWLDRCEIRIRHWPPSALVPEAMIEVVITACDEETDPPCMILGTVTVPVPRRVEHERDDDEDGEE